MWRAEVSGGPSRRPPVAIIVACACAGCVHGPCAGGAVLVPAVGLGGSSSFVAHPAAVLSACFAQHCQEMSAQQDRVQLMQVFSDAGHPELFTVSTTGAHPRQLTREGVALRRAVTIHDSICGDVVQWGLNARVTADGGVEILDWSGSSLQPATTIPTPSATP